MKKLVKATSVLLTAVLLCGGMSACFGGGNDDGTDSLTLARWDIAQVNAARKQNSPLYEAIKTATGIDVSVTSVSLSSYDDKLNLNYASGALPDVFIAKAWDTPSTYKKWIKDGAVVNFSDYVTESEYPNVYARLKQFDFLKDTLSYANGSHYALPVTMYPLHCFYVRTDWIDNLNAKLGDILVAEGIVSTKAQYEASPDAYSGYRFKIPDTLTEFYRLVYAFTEYDPDNDGSKNTYGYSCCTKNMWYNNWVFEAMSSADVHDSAYWGYVEDGNGGIQTSWVTEGNKKSVYFLNKLYNEGILNPDYIVLSEQDCRTLFIQGSVGIYMENCYYNTLLKSFMESYEVDMETAKTMFTCAIPPAGEHGVRGMRCDPGFWDGVCISNSLSERKIRLALKLLDYLCGPEAAELFTWGIEGVHYEVVDGKRVGKMGTDEKGFNYTLNTFDNAFPLSSFSSWTFMYDSPYESNRELIDGFFDAMKQYGKHDPFSVMQPEAYVEYDLSISNNAMEHFVGLIKDASYYNAEAKKGFAVGDRDWDDITGSARFYTEAYNNEWTSFCEKLLTNWKGRLVVDALSQMYPAHKDYYDDFFAKLYR